MYQRDPGMLNDVPFFWESLDDVYLFFETWIRSSPVRLLRSRLATPKQSLLRQASLSFALYTAPLGPDEEMSQVATADYVFAGVTGIMNVVYEDGKGEIGPVLIDKAFRVSSRLSRFGTTEEPAHPCPDPSSWFAPPLHARHAI